MIAFQRDSGFWARMADFVSAFSGGMRCIG
jgi:hypothetical protein